ncbi:MAG: trypsin-like peptidase domain-containing protein [Patescibacteria group bacterium]
MTLPTSKIAQTGLAAGLLTLVILGGSIGAAVYERSEVARVQEELTTLTARYAALQNQSNALATSIQTASSGGQSGEQILTGAVAKTTPAVVSIIISKDVPKVQVSYERDPFFGISTPAYKQVGTEKQEVGAGSGFIIRSDGYILTNKHVASADDAEYTVLLSTGVQKKAKVIARDKEHDLALLKIDGTGYATLPLGDSSKLQLGQSVVAIGNALGEYSNSVSVGIISGLNRSLEALNESGEVEKLDGVIQTDAAINRGNSGGPLIDLRGNAIGINVAIVRGSNSIAFSLPVNDAKELLKAVK